MKVFEKVLKTCIGKKIRVNYGRCSDGRGVSKCQVEGILWAFDNLCMVVGVYSQKGEIIKLVVIKKNEVESIEILDRELIHDVYEVLYGENGGAGD